MIRPTPKEALMNISNIRTKIIALQKRRLDLEFILIRSRKKMEQGLSLKYSLLVAKETANVLKGKNTDLFFI